MTQPIEHKTFEPIYTFHISNNGLGQLGHLWGNKPPVALIFPKIWHQKNPLGKYRIASNKRRGRSFNFWHFFLGGRGGVYSREAFTRGRCLLQNTEKITILYQRQWFRRLLLSENQNYLLHQRLESVIRSNGLGRSGSANTSNCDINCSLPFWQGSPSLKQWIKTSSEPLVLRFKPHDFNELEKGGGGVYSKGAFIK